MNNTHESNKTNYTGDGLTPQCRAAREMFPDYLTDDLKMSAIDEIRLHVAECTTCREELEELTSTWSRLGVLPEKQPGPNLRKNFYTMLESYSEGMSRAGLMQRFFDGIGKWFARPRKPAYQSAFILLFLVIGFAGGFILSNGSGRPEEKVLRERTRLIGEVRQVKQQLALSMLDQSSPSRRIKGIAWTAGLEDPGRETLDALLYRLNHDSSVNVRLSAVEALYLFADDPAVKQGLIDALPNQKSPLVQMALIDLVVELREKKAANALKRLIEDEKLNPTVKQRAKLGIRQL